MKNISKNCKQEGTIISKALEPLAVEARKYKTVEEFEEKLWEIKQWGEQRHRTSGFPQLSAMPGEEERYNKWYENLSPEKKALEDLYVSYRNVPNRGITISDFYKQAKQAPAPEGIIKVGDTITNGMVRGKVIGEGSIKFGKSPLPAYKVKILTGHEKGTISLMIKTDSKLVSNDAFVQQYGRKKK